LGWDISPAEPTPQIALTRSSTIAGELPICVDLDGTLVRTDTLHEIALSQVLDWRKLLRVPMWLYRGRAHLKQQLALNAEFDPSLLPYNAALLDYLRQQRARGRRLVLATAADRRVAAAINGHLKIFDEIITSDGARNLRGEAKRSALVARFGERGFTYIGNDRHDIPVWTSAAGGVAVNSTRAVIRQARRVTDMEAEIRDRPGFFRTFLAALRPHQWVKNVLVFVPIFTANALTDPGGWVGALAMFAAFCLTASSIYIVNDLIDLSADRKHPRKRNRPFASGNLPIVHGLAWAPVLATAGLMLAAETGALSIVVAYMAFSLLYSLKLKEMPLVDIFGLAGLYTIRLFGGGAASGYMVSPWLLAFSGFLFLSLAAVKRVAELSSVRRTPGQTINRRGYSADDQRLLEITGIVSSTVLALYV
jgi:4-hydroxybenzoate polyprenyltransferase